MPAIADLTVHQARRFVRAFQAHCEEHARRMQLLEMKPLWLTCESDGDYVLMDLAAFMSIVLSLPRLGPTGRVLRQLKTEDTRTAKITSLH